MLHGAGHAKQSSLTLEKYNTARPRNPKPRGTLRFSHRKREHHLIAQKFKQKSQH
jgi:hypothetical protein